MNRRVMEVATAMFDDGVDADEFNEMFDELDPDEAQFVADIATYDDIEASLEGEYDEDFDADEYDEGFDEGFDDLEESRWKREIEKRMWDMGITEPGEVKQAKADFQKFINKYGQEATAHMQSKTDPNQLAKLARWRQKKIADFVRKGMDPHKAAIEVNRMVLQKILDPDQNTGGKGFSLDNPNMRAKALAKGLDRGVNKRRAQRQRDRFAQATSHDAILQRIAAGEIKIPDHMLRRLRGSD